MVAGGYPGELKTFERLADERLVERMEITPTCLVLTTAGTSEEAAKIAHALVERKLAACVNIVPRIESVYRWRGKVESAAECLLIVKTRLEAFEQVRAAIQELHSYELPECVMLEIGGGSPAYLEWIADSVQPS